VARVGIVEVNAIAESHVLESPDPAAKTAGEDHHLADLALWPRYFARVFVKDVGCGNDINVRQRRIAIAGAEDVEDLLGAL